MLGVILALHRRGAGVISLSRGAILGLLGVLGWRALRRGELGVSRLGLHLRVLRLLLVLLLLVH